MRIGIYARVSTTDKDQNPETQLLPLREFAAAQRWTVAGEFVDRASATDLRGRIAWRELLDQAAKRRLDVILVWKLDRAFRSVAHMANTVEQLRRWASACALIRNPGSTPPGHRPAHRHNAGSAILCCAASSVIRPAQTARLRPSSHRSLRLASGQGSGQRLRRSVGWPPSSKGMK